MTSPPAARPETQEPPVDLAAGGKARLDRLPGMVRVVNAPWNGRSDVRRRTAEFFLSQGRAVRVGRDAIQLLDGPRYRAATAIAARDYNAIDSDFEWAIGKSGGSTVLKAHRASNHAPRQQ